MDIETMLRLLGDCCGLSYYDSNNGIEFDRDRARAILKVAQLEATVAAYREAKKLTYDFIDEQLSISEIELEAARKAARGDAPKAAGLE